jgi:excisionase family DNA binding protein
MTNQTADWRAWSNTASNLLASAQVLWNTREREFPRDAVIDPVPPDPPHADIAAPTASGGWLPFDHAATFLLLAGLSLEALCKAVIVQREARRLGGTIAALPRDFRNHKVASLLSEVGVTLGREDHRLVERLEVFVAWAGRYPLAKAKQPVAELEIRDDDFDRLNNLSGTATGRINGSAAPDWLPNWLRRPYITLTQFALICCGWNPARHWEIADIRLYNCVLETIRMAVKVRDIPIIEDVRYEEPSGHALTQAEDDDPWRWLKNDAERAARQERAAGAAETLFRLRDKRVWQWAIYQFPDTVPFAAADFEVGSGDTPPAVSSAASAAPSPTTNGVEAQVAAALAEPLVSDHLLTIKAIATRLNVNEQTIRRWGNNGKIEIKKLGPRSYRIDRSELNRLLATGRYDRRR